MFSLSNPSRSQNRAKIRDSKTLAQKLRASNYDLDPEVNNPVKHPYGDRFTRSKAKDATWKLIECVEGATVGRENISLPELQKRLAIKADELDQTCSATAARMPSRLKTFKKAATGFVLAAAASVPVAAAGAICISLFHPSAIGGVPEFIHSCLALTAIAAVPLSLFMGVQGAGVASEGSSEQRYEAKKALKTMSQEVRDLRFASKMIPKWVEIYEGAAAPKS